MWTSSEITSSTSVILRDEKTEVMRSSVTGLQHTVNPLSSAHLASLAENASTISVPSSVRTVPDALDLVTGTPAAASMLDI